ncbi:MAG: 30S ribosomal protein S20 [bacterium]|nr:30S ribosomal protein S20 [bacterium]
MANIKSAEKRIRKTATQQARNRTRRSAMRTAVKNLREAVEAGEANTARELLPQTLSIVDTTASKGVIHANTAARTKSRLTKAVASLDG